MPHAALDPRRPGAAALLIAALAIAGCGGGGHEATPSSPAGGTADLQRQFVQIVRTVSPAVVQIQTPDGLGSGVVYDGDGNIVTNNHVVGTSRTFTVTLAGGDNHPASRVGAFAPGDLAVIRLKSGKPPAATFADSSKAEPGDLVLAIGNPLGLRSSVTQGIVSSLGRTVGEGNGVVIASAIQTSAPINPGNSGGALVGLDGAVVGIPTLAAVDPQLGGGAAPGIGFAIPSNTVKRIADQLIASGHVTRSGRAFLGIEIATTVLAPGVVVARVEPKGPAARAGLRPGDVIVSVDGKPTRTADDLAAVLATLQPGQEATLKVLRPDSSRATVKVTLGEATG
jgi:S1-C subfamily serine protease